MLNTHLGNGCVGGVLCYVILQAQNAILTPQLISSLIAIITGIAGSIISFYLKKLLSKNDNNVNGPKYSNT
jgi:predicted membrane protein